MTGKQFDDDFLKSKQHELDGGKKVVKKKRKVVKNDEYIDVHCKLMRAMAKEEGSDLENWMKVQKGISSTTRNKQFIS